MGCPHLPLCSLGRCSEPRKLPGWPPEFMPLHLYSTPILWKSKLHLFARHPTLPTEASPCPAPLPHLVPASHLEASSCPSPSPRPHCMLHHSPAVSFGCLSLSQTPSFLVTLEVLRSLVGCGIFLLNVLFPVHFSWLRCPIR